VFFALILVLSLLAQPLLAATSPAPLEPGLAPGQNFNLALWKLTLPLDRSGGSSGTASEVKPIPATYQNAPYFCTGADGSMVFLAPSSGATTSGSHYPRSELRELTASGSNAAWTIADGGTLSASLAVNELPETSAGVKGRLVVGQIHGPDDELCRLYFDQGKLYFHDDRSGPRHTELTYTLTSSTGALTSIALDQRFDYTIRASSTGLTVSASQGGVNYSASEPISTFWPGKALYFKAGVYVQMGKSGSAAGTTGRGQGKVSFYRLAIAHGTASTAPQIITPPAPRL